MTIPYILAQSAYKQLQNGAILIDIRSQDEFARKHIEQAISIPIDKLAQYDFREYANKTLIFQCLSGIRTQQNFALLQTVCANNVQAMYILDGGLMAWEKAKLPIQQNSKIALDIMRQVQLIAGGLVLFGVILGTWFSPIFYALSAFVGAGLMFAGATGFCGMARLLMIMPWNQKPYN